MGCFVRFGVRLGMCLAIVLSLSVGDILGMSVHVFGVIVHPEKTVIFGMCGCFVLFGVRLGTRLAIVLSLSIGDILGMLCARVWCHCSPRKNSDLGMCGCFVLSLVAGDFFWAVFCARVRCRRSPEKIKHTHTQQQKNNKHNGVVAIRLKKTTKQTL